MTDKELLELAAKAAGIDAEYQNGIMVEVFGSEEEPETLYWNPLTDDGDALRLAVKLGMLVRHMHERFDVFQQFYCEELDNDLRPSEATRRAIVRAAAEIGRSMG